MSDVRNRRFAYAGGVLLGVIAGAVFVSPTWIASADNKSAQVTVVDDEAGTPVALPPYPTNDSGMTYGSGLNIDEKNPVPDLIAAIGVDGTYGYVRAEDRSVNDAPPANAEEAANWQSKGYTIPLYAVDGKTVIGKFKFQAGQSGEMPAEK